jgi:hypothetical protein
VVDLRYGCQEKSKEKNAPEALEEGFNGKNSCYKKEAGQETRGGEKDNKAKSTR